jgi:hypothetical protein
MVDYKQITTNVYVLTEEGSQIAASGSHEFRVWQACPAEGAGEPATVPELKVGWWNGVRARGPSSSRFRVGPAPAPA